MASGKGRLISALGGLLLRDAEVSAVDELGPHFRRVELRGDALCGRAWQPGDKVQVLLPSVDMRTYTPMCWDRDAGRTELLLYCHDGSMGGDTNPGAAWARAVRTGETVRFLGPQRSLEAPTSRPLVVFGDETSFAVARALGVNATPVEAVFEVAHPTEAATVLDTIGVATRALYPRTPHDSHLTAVADHLATTMQRDPRTALLLTGRAQSIQRLRTLLRDNQAARASATRAYWSVGKRGLD